MREFHNLDMPGPKKVFLWERMRYLVLHSRLIRLFELKKSSDVFVMLCNVRNWLGKAKSLCSLKDIKEFGLSNLDEEIKLLERELPDEHQEIGFCHNDLQYGNIMIDEKTNMITIIVSV